MLARLAVVAASLGTAALLTAAIQQKPTPAPTPEKPPAAPTFASAHTFLDEAGRPVTLEQLADGKPLAVIVMKGTHCRACRAELRRLEERAAELARLDVRVVAVSADPPQAHAEMKENLDVRFVTLTDPDGRALKSIEMWMAGPDMPLPGVLFLDRCGDLAGVYRGRRPGRAQTKHILGGLEELAGRATCGRAA
jgi:peroxiredoxin